MEYLSGENNPNAIFTSLAIFFESPKPAKLGSNFLSTDTPL